MYEGEWVDDVPKCGQFSAAPPGSFPEAEAQEGAGAEAGAAAPFELPALRLVRPDGVLSEAIAVVRQQRAKKVPPVSSPSPPAPLVSRSARCASYGYH